MLKTAHDLQLKINKNMVTLQFTRLLIVCWTEIWKGINQLKINSKIFSEDKEKSIQG